MTNLVRTGRNFWPRADLVKIGPLNGQIPGRTGSVDFSTRLLSTLARYGVEPLSPHDFRANLDRAKRQINDLDLRHRFNGEFALISSSNPDFKPSSNNIFNTYICPRFPTTQMNFEVTEWDAYLAPFDEMTPLNIPNVTHHQNYSKTFTLSFFRRAAEFEMHLLLSEFGPETWDRATLVLLKQYEYTELVCTTDALISAPTQRRLMYYNGNNRIDYNREMLHQRDRLFCATRGAKYFMNLINQDIMEAPRVVLTGSTNLLKYVETMEGGPANVPSFVPRYDPERQSMVMDSHELGDATAKTIPMTNGTVLDVVPFRPIKALKIASADEAFNPFKGQVVLGEVIQQPPFSVEHLANAEATISTKMLEVAAAKQTQHEIENKRIGFLDNLPYNLLFMNKDGTTKDEGLSDYYDELAKEYNKNVEEFRKAFRLREHSDNNKPSTQYLASGEQPGAMTGFRHYDGFLCYNDAAGPNEPKIQKPVYWGDVEIKTLPPKEVYLRAQVLLHSFGTEFFALNGRKPTLKESVLFLKNLFPGHGFLQGIRDDDTDADISDEVDLTLAEENSPNIHKDERFTLGSTPNFGLPIDNPIRPQPNETRAAYEARYGNVAALKNLVTKKALDKKSSWVGILAHVPDSGIPALSTILHAVLQAPEVSAADTAALKQIAEELAVYSNRPHATEILETISNQLKKDQKATVASVMAAFNGKAILTHQQEQRLSLDTAVQSKSLSDAVRLGAGAFGYRPLGAVHSADNRRQRHSWIHHNNYLNSRKTDDRIVRYTYLAILDAKVGYKSALALGRYGVSLFRVEYHRLFMRFDTEGAYLVVPGSDTWFLAVMQPNARMSTAGVEGSVTIVVDAFMGVIVKNNQNFYGYETAFCSRYVHGRNLNIIRTRGDMPTRAPNDYPSMLAVARPLTETTDDFPLNLLPAGVYNGINVGTFAPNKKTSVSGILRTFIGKDKWYRAMNGSTDGKSPEFAVSVERAHTFRPVSNHPNNNIWKRSIGSGFIGLPAVNADGSVSSDAMMGIRELPDETQIPTEITV
jgi:hypothetical protein